MSTPDGTGPGASGPGVGGPGGSRTGRPHLVVAGGSVAGLAMALFAARRGALVTVLEADEHAAPQPFDESVARHPRWATPQAAHSHAFLARAVAIMRTEAPEVLDDLLEAGAELLDLVAQAPVDLPAGTDPIEVLLCRRTTFETVMRHRIAAEPGINVRSRAEVASLLLDRGPAVPHVRGVRLASGEVVSGDVVIDATGRRGPLWDQLVAAGLALEETDDDCGIAYHSRFYRRWLGASPGPLNRGYTGGSSFDRYSCLVFPGDGGTFSITFGVLPEDRQMAALRDPKAFDAAVQAIPLVAPWADPHRSAPISDVHRMSRMRNRLRRTVAQGRPGVTGYLPLADAAAISNPAHSRGCALALWHAQRLADLLLVDGGLGASHELLAVRADAVVGATLAPWVADSRRQDRARLSRWRPEAVATVDLTDGGAAPDGAAVPDGAAMPDVDAVTSVSNGAAWTAGHHDPVVWLAFARLQQLLALPAEVLEDPDVVQRVRSVQQQGLGLPAHPAPSHRDMCGLVVDATRPAVAKA